MKARNCCKTMEMELTAWKAIIYDIARKMDKFSGGEKEKFHPHIEDLHILVEELDQRIDEIREKCTPETGIDDIKTERKAFDTHMTSLRMKTEDAMKMLGAGDFGG